MTKIGWGRKNLVDLISSLQSTLKEERAGNHGRNLKVRTEAEILMNNAY